MAFSRLSRFLLLGSSTVSLVYGLSADAENLIYRTITVSPTVTVTVPADGCALTLDNSLSSPTSSLSILATQTTTITAANGPLIPYPDNSTNFAMLSSQTTGTEQYNGLLSPFSGSAATSSVALNSDSQPTSLDKLMLSATSSSSVAIQTEGTILSTIEVATGGLYLLEGCYPDLSGTGSPVTDPSDTTVGSSTECISTCYNGNFNVAGIEGISCYCSNSFDQSAAGIPMSNCMAPCADNPLLACGDGGSAIRKRDGGHMIVYMMPDSPKLTLPSVSLGASGTPSLLPIVSDINGLLGASPKATQSSVTLSTNKVLTKTVLPIGQPELQAKTSGPEMGPQPTPSPATTSPSTTSIQNLHGPYIAAAFPLNSTQINATTSNIASSGSSTTGNNQMFNGLAGPASTLAPGTTSITSPISNTNSTILQLESSGAFTSAGRITLGATISINESSSTLHASVTRTVLALNGPARPISTSSNLVESITKSSVSVLATSTIQNRSNAAAFTSPTLTSTSKTTPIALQKTKLEAQISSTSSSKLAPEIENGPLGLSPTLTDSSSDFSSIKSTIHGNSKTFTQTGTSTILTTASMAKSSQFSSSSTTSAQNDRIQNGLPEAAAPIATLPSSSSSANKLVASSLSNSLVTATRSNTSITSKISSTVTEVTTSSLKSSSASSTPLSSASVIANGPLDIESAIPTPTTFLTVTTSASPTCTPPSLLNGDFESGELKPWIEILPANTSSTATVYSSSEKGINAFGDAYLNTTVLAGQTQTFYQVVSTCPTVEYRITAYGQIAAQKQGHRSDQPCGFQICEGVCKKCSEEQILQEDGFDALSLRFKATTNIADVQVMVNCAAEGGFPVNYIFLDEITIVAT